MSAFQHETGFSKGWVNQTDYNVDGKNGPSYQIKFTVDRPTHKPLQQVQTLSSPKRGPNSMEAHTQVTYAMISDTELRQVCEMECV